MIILFSILFVGIEAQHCKSPTLNGTGLMGSGTHVINSTLTQSWSECCNLCASYPDCTGWTWHPPKTHSNNQCKIASDHLNPHDSDGALSGYILQPTPPPSPSPPPTPYPYPPIPPLGFQPNIVFILTDDQDVELGGLEPMTRTHHLLAEKGVSFRHFYVNSPVCCPSRSEYLSGRYHHNIRDDRYLGSQGCGDEAVGKPHPCDCMRINSSTILFEKKTYADYMQDAGYMTAYFGKYLNPPAMEIVCGKISKNGTVRMPGWNRFMGMCNTAYYDVTWANDGMLIKTGKDPSDYTTSIIGNKTVDFIRTYATSSSMAKKPFLLVAAPRAPHGPQTPAEWYKHALPSITNRITPAWNHSCSDHVGWIANLPPLSTEEASKFDSQFRDRWRTLLSVDDLVDAVISELSNQGMLDNTFVFYSSDHGYHLGHMRLGSGKSHMYEFDSRVPFLVRGPHITPNSTAHFIAGNVDLAPTFLDLAGWRGPNNETKPAIMDGRSFVSQLLTPTITLQNEKKSNIISPNSTSDGKTWRDTFLIEFAGLSKWKKSNKILDLQLGRQNDSPNNTYRALRFVANEQNQSFYGIGPNVLYTEYAVSTDWQFQDVNFRELYDVDNDPFQLHNLWNSITPKIQEKIMSEMNETWRCKGDTCP